MRRFQIAAILFVLVWTSIAAGDDSAADDRAANESAVDLTTIDRTIAREPKYQSQPHYALLVFGSKAEHRCWLVIDGDGVAHVDRNGNGDLTDPGERVDLDVKATEKIRLGGPGAYKANHVFPLGEVAGTKLVFHLWVRNPDFDASKDDFYRDHFRTWDEKKWVNGSLMRIAKDGSRAQNPLLLTIRAVDAQIAHFDGPVTCELKWGDRQRLEPWPKQSVFDVHIGTRSLLAKNCVERGFGLTRLTISEVPAEIHPIAKFEIPAATLGDKPIVRELALGERCCGDSFYTILTLPKGAVAGNVKVTVECPAWGGRGTTPAKFIVPINQGVSIYGEIAYVMFHDPKIKIDGAVSILRKRGMEVFIQSETLAIYENDKPTFNVRLVGGNNIQNTSAELAQGTEHAEKLSRCDARFEISFLNADKILQQPTTLVAIQSALQELTHGYLYTSWDKKLTGPR